MKKFICMILTMVMVLSLVDCGSNEITTVQTDKPSGTVSTDGSTSMEKVIGGLGEMFMERNSGITYITVPIDTRNSPQNTKWNRKITLVFSQKRVYHIENKYRGAGRNAG